MALIKINIADTLLSESAAKKPGYHIGRVGGANTLVVNSTHKAAVGRCISNARKAQKLALSALKNRITANTMVVKIKSEDNPARKTKMRESVKTLKTKSSADVKTAKQLLREGTAALKAAGLSALSSPLKATDIALTPYPGKSSKTVSAAQTDSLVVKGKKGYMKPKFLAASKFDALVEKKAVKAGKPAKKTGMTAGGVGGAHTPAKAKALKAKRATQLTGTAPTTPKEISKAVNTELNKTLKKFGLSNKLAHLSDKSGNLLDTATPDKKKKIINTLRTGFESHDVPIKSLRNGGFIVPGILKVNNSKQFGIEVSKLSDWVHPGKSKK